MPRSARLMLTAMSWLGRFAQTKPAVQNDRGKTRTSKRSAHGLCAVRKVRKARHRGVARKSLSGDSQKPNRGYVAKYKLRWRSGSQRGRCSVFASGMSQGLRLDGQERHRAELG